MPRAALLSSHARVRGVEPTAGDDAVLFVFFFFQAEDGIRDVAVTGVQTCALPIFLPVRNQPYVGETQPGERYFVRHPPVECDSGRGQVETRSVFAQNVLVAAPPIDRKSVV